jgi:hypothetical protein
MTPQNAREFAGALLQAADAMERAGTDKGALTAVPEEFSEVRRCGSC